MNVSVAIIGGTGFESALQDRLGAPEQIDAVTTPYGSAAISIFADGDLSIAFLARHGAGHSIAPHRINHLANIVGLTQIGVKAILSTSAVGSLRAEIKPGDIVIPDDFIDLRGGPPNTLYNESSVTHTDFSEPLSVRLRDRLLHGAKARLSEFGLPDSIIHPAGVYLCVHGPRYETPAEVRCFAGLGADIVGMTVAPEAILAREAGIAYASISIATNLGTGLTSAPLSHAEVEEMMRTRRPLLTAVLADAARAEARS